MRFAVNLARTKQSEKEIALPNSVCCDRNAYRLERMRFLRKLSSVYSNCDSISSILIWALLLFSCRASLCLESFKKLL